LSTISPKYYDVIVIGAGPAGSMSAYYLARRGLSVLILDKEDFPRFKPCGGGLSHRALSLFPYDLTPVIESTVYSFRFSHRFEDAYTHVSRDPLVHGTMRSKLDDFMLKKAIGKGAEFLPNYKVTGFTETFDHVLVHTAETEFSGRYIIGADGVGSITARSFQLTDNVRKGVGIESEIRVDKETLARFHGKACLDWGTFVRGYAWVFPKHDHLSVGVGGPASLAKYLKPYYFRFLKSLEIEHVEILSYRSFPIPFRTGLGKVQTSRVMVVGDAAGLADPLTGYGSNSRLRAGSWPPSLSSMFWKGVLTMLIISRKGWRRRYFLSCWVRCPFKASLMRLRASFTGRWGNLKGCGGDSAKSSGVS
jgi:geranylgeranyl reductase family protein